MLENTANKLRWFWTPSPRSCINTNTWFAVASVSKPPDTDTPWQRKWSRQFRVASSLLTDTSVVDPTQDLKPGRSSSCCNSCMVSFASRSLSVFATRLANMPKAWSSLQCVWLFLRKSIAQSLIFRRPMRFCRYSMVWEFFTSLTVLSDIKTSLDGMGTFRRSQIVCTFSRPSETIWTIELLSCFVHSSKIRRWSAIPGQKHPYSVFIRWS